MTITVDDVIIGLRDREVDVEEEAADRAKRIQTELQAIDYRPAADPELVAAGAVYAAFLRRDRVSGYSHGLLSAVAHAAGGDVDADGVWRTTRRMTGALRVSDVLDRLSAYGTPVPEQLRDLSFEVYREVDADVAGENRSLPHTHDAVYAAVVYTAARTHSNVPVTIRDIVLATGTRRDRVSLLTDRITDRLDLTLAVDDPDAHVR